MDPSSNRSVHLTNMSGMGQLLLDNERAARKLHRVRQRRDHYARLYFQTLSQLEETKWKLEHAVHTIRDLKAQGHLNVHPRQKVFHSNTTSPDSGASLSPGIDLVDHRDRQRFLLTNHRVPVRPHQQQPSREAWLNKEAWLRKEAWSRKHETTQSLPPPQSSRTVTSPYHKTETLHRPLPAGHNPLDDHAPLDGHTHSQARFSSTTQPNFLRSWSSNFPQQQQWHSTSTTPQEQWQPTSSPQMAQVSPSTPATPLTSLATPLTAPTFFTLPADTYMSDYPPRRPEFLRSRTLPLGNEGRLGNGMPWASEMPSSFSEEDLLDLENPTQQRKSAFKIMQAPLIHQASPSDHTHLSNDSTHPHSDHTPPHSEGERDMARVATVFKVPLLTSNGHTDGHGGVAIPIAPPNGHMEGYGGVALPIAPPNGHTEGYGGVAFPIAPPSGHMEGYGGVALPIAPLPNGHTEGRGGMAIPIAPNGHMEGHVGVAKVPPDINGPTPPPISHMEEGHDDVAPLTTDRGSCCYYDNLSSVDMLDLLLNISSRHCTIQKLEVRRSYLGQAEPMKLFCASLARNHSITELSLPENSIGGPALTLLLHTIKAGTAIRELKLRKNLIGQDCAGLIKQLLSDTMLESLVLTGNEIEQFGYLLNDGQLRNEFSMEYGSDDSGVHTTTSPPTNEPSPLLNINSSLEYLHI